MGHKLIGDVMFKYKPSPLQLKAKGKISVAIDRRRGRMALAF
jgi:hypothetical protein